MSALETAAPPRKPWGRWLALGAAGGAVVLLSAGVMVLGPAGPGLAAALANGRDVWRLGTLRVERVGGAGLGDLTVGRATLSDEDGVWAVAENLSLKWEPLRLLAGEVALKSGAAERLRVVRLPKLGPPRDHGPVTIDTDIGAVSIKSVEFAKAVTGDESRFSLAGGVSTRDGDVLALKVRLDRLDGARPEYLRADYARGPLLALSGHLEGPQGGAFAHLLGRPEARLVAVAEGASTVAGAGAASVRLEVVAGASATARPTEIALRWTRADWSLNGSLDLDALPALAAPRARLGPRVELKAAGETPRAGGAPFEATVSSAELSGQVAGRLRDDFAIAGPVTMALTAARAGVVLPETNLEAGAAQFDGVIEFDDDETRIAGRANLRGWRRTGFTLDAEGPIELRLTAARAAFEGDFAGKNVVGPLPELSRLAANPRIVVRGAYDRQEGVTRIERLSVAGPDFTLRGAGRTGEGATRYEGEWSAPHLNAAIKDMGGALAGRWTLRSAPEGLALEVAGAGSGVSGRSPLAVLLAGAPKLDARLTFGETVARLDHARLDGRALRLGARGVLSGAPMNVRLEASARGPVEIAGLRLTGALDATGAATGSLAQPRLHMEAALGAVDVGGATLEQAKVGLDLAQDRRGQAGQVTLNARLWNKPLQAQGRLAMRDTVIAFDDVAATLGQLTAHGRASFAPAGPNADLTLGGAIDGLAPELAGQIDGALRLATAREGQGALDLSARVTHARYGARIAADEVSVRAQGPLTAMAARYRVKGWAGDDSFVLAGDGRAGFTRRGLELSLGAAGDYAGAVIATRAPISARLQGSILEARAALSIADGGVDITWLGGGDRLSATARFDHAPLHILTAMFNQPLAGVIDGRIALSGARDNLSGDLDFTLSDARLARRSRDSVDATIKAKLGGGMLTGRFDARSEQGLVASAEGQAPVRARAAPFSLAAAPLGQGRAHWTVSGPVEGLWGLFGPLDQSLAGRIEGAGDTTFGRNGMSGAGRLTLASGAFEDKLTGIKLRDIDAALEFDRDGVRLERFAASDGRGGAINGSGRLDGPDNGHLELTLANLRLLDRADAKATDHGTVLVTWKDGKALLTGDIELAQADIRSLGADAPITAPVIDVIEVNRAGPQTRAQAVKPGSTIPVAFDVRVHAPGQLFTRTRGLDAEWALDARLRGDSAEPLLYGAAQLIRGDFALAGRRFTLESGEVRFNGDPEDAELALVAVADTPELSVRVQIAGRAADPQIELSSTPALPQDEILPQLLFGRSSRELSPFEAAQLAASLAALAGKSAFDIAGAARSAVDLDRLEVRQEQGGFLISGGKYLTRDVYLEVARGPLGQASTAVEWQVRPRLYVISSFRAEGEQRIALRWKRDY